MNKYARFKNNVIVAGDMNCCCRDIDRSPKTHLNDKSRTTMKYIMNNCNLTDVWAKSHDKNPGFTYVDKFKGTKSRLDYFIVSEDIMTCVKCVDLNVCPFVPDHLALCMNIVKPSRTRGSGYWKMNSNVLEKPDFRENLIHVVNRVETDYKQYSPLEKWEILKFKVKELAINCSVKHTLDTKRRKCELQKRLNVLIQDREDSSKTESISNIEKELDEIYSAELKGALIRSKAKWIEEGEKSTKYFYSLERKHQLSNVINQLVGENGEIIEDPSELLNECCSFYDKLYTSDLITDISIDNYLSDIQTPVLNENEKQKCDLEVSELEIYEAIKNLKSHKSPGLDGITPEFYKEYWEIIKLPFMNMVKEVYLSGDLSCSMKTSVITLIFKKGNKQLLKNYRPISLSNYDYKIIAFVLAARLQKVVGKLIHTDQSGYIKGRFIGQNARFIHDIYEFCEGKDLPGVILNLDFEKAYDRLEWNFLFKVLEKFNFGKNYIKWIKILYNQPKIAIKNNGWISKSLKMSRGIRQGCPVSSLLFVIAIEIMAIKIRNDENIHGFTFNNELHKLSQYADDTTLTLSDMMSVPYAIKCINTFCQYSGMKLNVEKTEGIWLGPYKSNPELYEGITFTKAAVRCLGLYLGHDKEGCYRENWLSKINRMENSLHVWKSRKLTLRGKILIIKTIALSQLIYSFTVLHVPTDIQKVIEKCIYDFIWNKKDRIKRKTMINDLENGGLKMVDVESKIKSLKSSWIPRLMNSERTASVLQTYLKNDCLSLEMLLNGNIYQKSMLDSLAITEFYKDCITSFNSCKEEKKLNVHEYLTQPIWCNKLFIRRGKGLLFKHWLQSDFKYVKDLYDASGMFVNEEYVLSKLKNKRNWITEYSLVKQTVHKMSVSYNMEQGIYENVMNNNVYLYNCNCLHQIDKQKSRFFYDLLVYKKRERSFMEKYWCKEFERQITQCEWRSIYLNGIHSLPSTKLAEFSYKMIHGLLVSRIILSKWKRINTELCHNCNEREDVKHIYYNCKIVQEIWSKLGKVMNIDIQWKHIIFGLTQDITVHRVRNLILKIFLYAIFKLWLRSLEHVTSRTMNFVWLSIVKDFNEWNDIIGITSFDKNHKVFVKMWQEIYSKF